MVNTENLRRKADEIDTKPTTLEAAHEALAAFDQMIEAYAESIDELASENEDLEDEVQDLKGQVAEAADALTHAVEDLEAIRQLVAVGRTGEALHNFDRILQGIDPKCKRLIVVVPGNGLPVAGGFL